MKHISPFRYTEATQDEVVANLIAGAAIAGRNRTLSLATLVKRGLDRVPRSVDGAQPCTLAPAPWPMYRAVPDGSPSYARRTSRPSLRPQHRAGPLEGDGRLDNGVMAARLGQLRVNRKSATCNALCGA